MRRRDFEFDYWHVFNRGVRRLGIFCNDPEYLEFLRILKYSSDQSGAQICAYCLMPNHFHLILKGCRAEITALMRRLERLYSVFHNEQHELSGANFEGPYQRHPQRSPYLLGQRLAYVLLNPVAGGLVSDPADYRWSCYKSYVDRPGSPMEVDPQLLLNAAGRSFKEIMEDYRAPESTSNEPKHRDVMIEQVRWLESHAERRGSVVPFSARDLAIYWAREAGVRPDAIGLLWRIDGRVIRNRLYYLRKCLAADPDLREQVALD